MANEAIYVSPELKKRLIREAVACGMTLDEYLAAHPGPQPATSNENGNGHAEPQEEESLFGGASSTMKQMRELYMMRALSNGQPIPGMTGDSGGGSDRRVLDRLESIERRLEARTAAAPVDDMGIDAILKSVIKYRAMGPVLSMLDGSGGGGGPGSANREMEKELRGAVDRVRDQMLIELRAKDTQISGIQQAAAEARIADMKSVVESLRDEISSLSTRLENGPSAQQGNVADQLTQSLQQAAAVQSALEALSKRGQPPPPTTGPQSTVETIAYLANELSGAVSKGLEAVARVNAAQRGHNPDAIGRMPPPGQPAPSYRPAYVDTPPQRPPPQRPPARRAPPATDTPTVGRGMRMPFEGARPPSPPPPPLQEPAAPPEGPQKGPPQLDVNQLAPLDPRITQFQGPQGQPISREEYQALREAVYLQSGRDPLEVREVDAPPPAETSAPPTEEAPPEGGEGGEFIDGTPDSDSTQG